MSKRIIVFVASAILISLALLGSTAADIFISPIPCPYVEDTLGYEICCQGTQSSFSWMCDEATPIPTPEVTPTISSSFCVGLTSGYVLCY